MPELPEVETIRRSLAGLLAGKTITGVEVVHPGVIKAPDPQTFPADLTGRTFVDFDRRGKYLLLKLTGDMVLVVHLRMTGRLVVTAPETERARHTHLVLSLRGGQELRFVDTRRFGAIYLLPADRLGEISGLSNLGPEPLDPEFSLARFKEVFKGKNRALKGLLLDQTFVAGLGNIYADEVLARARLNPARKAGELSTEEVERLYLAIREELTLAIEHRGTSFRDYVDGLGQKGENQNYLKVYQRRDQPCSYCGAPIVREKLARRSTFYCPHCQK